MQINHNLAALNTLNKLNTASTAQAKSMEKLSSGLRINRAGDDAAGLAISEKMRGQIRGLDQANRNAQDGISMIQTAEGALNETHDILQRMRELAVQAGNDTNTDSDRGEIQKEINQLTSEVNRIGNTTEFNTKKLLNGGKEDVAVNSITAGKAEVTAVKGEFSFKYSDLGTLNDGDTVNIGGTDYTYDSTGTAGFKDADSLATAISGTYTAANTGGTITLTQATAANDTTGPAVKDVSGAAVSTTVDKAGVTGVTAVAGKFEFTLDTSKLKDGQILSIGTKTYTFNSDGSGDFKDLASLKTKIDGDGDYTTAVSGNKITFTQTTGNESNAAAPKVSIQTNTTGNFTASLQIGANESQSMTIDINDMRASALGLTGTDASYTKSTDVSNGTDSTGTESALDVSTATNAANAITKIQSAIDQVSAERSKLGANQNRLEHTINNLSTSSENLTAAESRIRDVDMAKEMMNQTKNSILSQAAQAMLAQSNQMPQGVLQLLR